MGTKISILFNTSSNPRIRQNYPGSYREVLHIATPLILSTASLTMMLFVDRIFLARHSVEEVAAAVPAGITYFTICSFFIGIAEYANSIVAQNYGAGRFSECSKAVTQGMLFSVISMPLILLCIPLGLAVIDWGGHDPGIAVLEKDYFTILMFGGALLPFNAAVSCFFSGRGRTRIVMWGNLAANLANIGLAYVLIFGKLGFPELGIHGAAIATAVTNAIPGAYWLTLFLSDKYQSKYGTRKAFVWDKGMFTTLLKYGIPSGAQFFLDVAAFTVFVLLVGRLGKVNLAATNIVLSIEMLNFLPMIGMSIATATLVGWYLGRETPELAEKSVYSALKLTLLYTGVLGFLFLAVPGLFLSLFISDTHAVDDIEEVIAKASILIRVMAVYSMLDGVFIIFSGALKGAGDTKFAMWAQVCIAWGLFVVPLYVGIAWLNWGVYAAWICVLLYVVFLSIVFWWRFRTGKWKQISLLRT